MYSVFDFRSAQMVGRMMRRYLLVGAATVIVLMLLLLLSASWWTAASFSNRSMLDYASNSWTTWRHGDLLERESRSIAGPNAVNCGRAPLGGPLRVNDCILKAIKEKKSFRGRYMELGIDFHAETAVVGASDGHAYEIYFMEGPYVPPESRLTKRECPQPLNLVSTKPNALDGGRLTCFPDSPQ
jgi:hypothetical protein